MEAADEVARQLRLRDLAGLIVIDFIDMEAKKHNGMVERRLKEALKNDRARIQVGHISHFGLMEMSRQRLRPSLAETSFIACPHCGGMGHVRSTESAAIHVLRGIEEEGAKRRAAEIVVYAAPPVALYILNHKRERLAEIEQRYGMRVLCLGDDGQMTSQFRIERLRAQVVAEAPVTITQDVALPPPAEIEAEEEAAAVEDEEDEAEAVAEPEAADAEEDAAGAVAGETAEEAERRRHKRRRRRRGGRREDDTAGAGSRGGGRAGGRSKLSRPRCMSKACRNMPRPVTTSIVLVAAVVAAVAGGGPMATARCRRTPNPAPTSPICRRSIPGRRPPTRSAGSTFDIFDVMDQAEAAGSSGASRGRGRCCSGARAGASVILADPDPVHAEAMRDEPEPVAPARSVEPELVQAEAPFSEPEHRGAGARAGIRTGGCGQ